MLMFGLISILIILYIYSVANAINDYKEKAYYYLKKITECEQNNEIKNKSNKELFFSVNKNYEICIFTNNHYFLHVFANVTRMKKI